MKYSLLAMLFILLGIRLTSEAQTSAFDPHPSIRLGEKRRTLERKTGCRLSPASARRRLPYEWAALEAEAYCYRDTTGIRTGRPLTVFLHKGKTLSALLAEYPERAYPELLRGMRKKWGAPYAYTTYKGYDFNGSGCPTQTVMIWRGKKRIVYLILLPEQHRCQYLTVLPPRD